MVLKVKYFDSVARLKAKYQESGKVVGRPDYIVLLFKGKELDDETTLGEHGISSGSVIVHIEPSHDPFRGINYRQLADSLAIQHRHMDENLRMLKQENIWAPDAEGTVRSLGLDHSLVNMPSPDSSSGRARGTGSSRSFCNQISVSVNALIFHVLPRMEGRWNGEMTVLPASQQDGTQVCASEILFREEERVWSQRQTVTTINGITTTHVSLLELSMK